MARRLPMLQLLLASLLLLQAEARPAEYAEYLGLGTDMATVGSLRREVRQPAPVSEGVATEVSDLLSSSNEPSKRLKNASGKSNEGGLFKTFGSDAEGEKGYLKKSFSKGDHGYKSLDTFHKKLGDRYGFEEHEAFGKASGEDQQHHEGKSAKSTRKHKQTGGDHEGAGTDVESHYADDGGSEYSEGGGDGEHYGDGESSSYNDGGNEGYSESYSSGDGDGYASGESYSAGGESSAEDDGGSGYY